MKAITALWVLGFVAWFMQLKVSIGFLSIELVSLVAGLIATAILIEKTHGYKG